MAGEHIRRIMEREKLPKEASLRLGITTEGCEGSGTEFRYKMDFEQKPPTAEDSVFESEGIRIYVERGSLSRLEGLQLDVQQGWDGDQLVFRNPRAKHSCGCGQTFSEEEPPPEE
jgi:iron-sulfur cluster assembly protein